MLTFVAVRNILIGAGVLACLIAAYAIPADVGFVVGCASSLLLFGIACALVYYQYFLTVVKPRRKRL